ncbi:sensor histidine kinase [Dyadobacter fermentans]|uniref:Signal transduction histidine kinase, LytS n=1 Tax=Dyadobacter fermentans (strain ATCC 700827 / DSM 18053 / CIP 107007 / KCTC 52180 / NS114) TaxID=471854 RepID=C6VTC8_DYAFD|nr:sensor histidine kinase [Dyadobacter fermentans]ACT96492.1 signal transduction histidine kinase, LytS [Dyadobacter fermentans DSM 18053]
MESRNSITILSHLTAWSLFGFILLFYPPLTWSITVPTNFWIKQALNLLIMIGIFYANALYVAPKLLFERKGKVVFGIWLAGIVVAFLAVARVIELKLEVLADMSKIMNKAPKDPFRLDFHLFMIMLLVMVISTSLALARRWQADAQTRERIEKQHIASELSFLKAQINPHFFFNTLNNIYSLTYSDVPVSREAILKLSRMMRYVLYDTLGDSVPLKQELSFLKDYIALMALRLHECTTLEFSEPVPDKDYWIAPMLLLPFVENAFKHGSSAMQHSKIQIELKVTDGSLSLRVFNHIAHENDGFQLDQGGIGLANTRKRLELLYDNRHTLVTREDAGNRTYEVLLTLKLDRENAGHIAEPV